MRRFARFRSLSLRSKIVVTVVGGAAAVLGGATYLSFRYWEQQSLAASEQQARLAATATRSTLEAAFRLGREAAVRRHLDDLRSNTSIVAARVYGSDGGILYSATPSEEGPGPTSVWIPDAHTLPREGVVHPDETAGTVRVFLPITAARAPLLEVVFSVEPIRSAMRRGARLGLGLLFGSVLAIGLIVGAMLEYEVVTPLHRMGEALVTETGGANTGRDEVGQIEHSFEQLLVREREAEARALEREGLAEVGELAAEMAHEFKRPLAAMRSALEVLDQEYHLDPQGRSTLTSVHEQLAHLADTVQDLFSLAMPVVPEAVQVSLTDSLDDALLEFAGQPGASRVRVVRQYDPGLSAVYGDERRLRQAFANLMTNALEAMPEGGTLSLTAQPFDDAWSLVTVSDTGVGFEAGAIEGAFRPFYSTKPLGTGLGLPLVARTIVAHGGHICVDSEPGAGSTISIFLPSADSNPRELSDPCPASVSSSSMTIT